MAPDSNVVHADLKDEVVFESKQAVLSPQGKATIDRIARAVTTVDLKTLTITGHADQAEESGPRRAQLLSERRAFTVRDAFVAAGVDRKRLVTQGAGFHDPVGDSHTDGGQQRNRRVDIRGDYQVGPASR